jgi:hypothetical protein
MPVSERRFLILVSIPLAVVFVTFVGWQQGLFSPDCEFCDGTGYCDYCAASSRPGRLLRRVDRALPSGSVRAFLSISSTLLGVLLWSFRRVPCPYHVGYESSCWVCRGSGRITRLDRWLAG